MELKIGRYVISRRGFQLIVFAAFIQGLICGAYYAASDSWKDVPIPILFMFVLSPLVVLYKPVRKEISLNK